MARLGQKQRFPPSPETSRVRPGVGECHKNLRKRYLPTAFWFFPPGVPVFRSPLSLPRSPIVQAFPLSPGEWVRRSPRPKAKPSLAGVQQLQGVRHWGDVPVRHHPGGRPQVPGGRHRPLRSRLPGRASNIRRSSAVAVAVALSPHTWISSGWRCSEQTADYNTPRAFVPHAHLLFFWFVSILFYLEP